ncbi:MAG: Crp/Fnr family transcriptional regulator, partial [Prevotella sp.]|nr:Crp/Fnr family transcriptional regulator [Prevotella sp.]
MATEFKISKSEIVNTIATLWTPLQDEEKQLLLTHLEIKKLRKNDFAYKIGQEARTITCLIKGKLKIFKASANGKDQIIRVVKPIDFLGYRAFFADEDYTTSAIAIESSVIATIPLTIIVELMHANPHVALFFLKHLSTVLGVADQRLVNLSQKHVRGRLADTLLFLQDTYGYEEDNQTLNVYLSRKELASLSNMTTSNAI